MINGNQKKYIKIIESFGIYNQIEKAIEEMGELTDELKKSFEILGISQRYKIRDEIVDVQNMINQLIIIFNFTEEDIKAGMKAKNERTLKRIEEGFYK